MMIIENEYEVGQTVYLVTDKDQDKRKVKAIVVYWQGELMYQLVSGTTTSEHYGFEISAEKDFVTT